MAIVVKPFLWWPPKIPLQCYLCHSLILNHNLGPTKLLWNCTMGSYVFQKLKSSLGFSDWMLFVWQEAILKDPDFLLHKQGQCYWSWVVSALRSAVAKYWAYIIMVSFLRNQTLPGLFSYSHSSFSRQPICTPSLCSNTGLFLFCSIIDKYCWTWRWGCIYKVNNKLMKGMQC